MSAAGERALAEIERFRKDREEALLSLDPDKIEAFAARWGAKIPPASHPSFWPAVHKAVTGAKDLPEDFRRQSIAWLVERGHTHFADDLPPLKETTR